MLKALRPTYALPLLLLLCACGRKDGKTSELVVIGPGESVSFSIDGGEAVTVAGNSRKVVNVTPGEHVVKVSAPAALEHNVTLKAYDRWVVPALKTQCFGKMDVSLSNYGKRSKKASPRLRTIRKSSEPFKLAKGMHLHPNDFPSSNKDGTPVWLFRSAGCDALAKMKAAQDKRAAGEAAARKARPKK